MDEHAQRAAVWRGAQWMMAAAFCWTTMNYFIVVASAELHPFEVAFFRSVLAVIFLLPWMVFAKQPLFPRRRVGALFALAAVQAVATLSWMEALAHIPLVEATALGFTTPFFGTLLAALFLGERIRIRRITAIAFGFAGVLVVLDPRDASLDPYALAALLCALTAAIYAVLLRRIAPEFHPNALVAYVFLFLIPLTGAPAMQYWSVPSWDAAQSLVAVGVLGTLGHLCMARAWASAEIAVVGPFDYVQLVFAAIIGAALLGEHPTTNVWLGAVLIVGSAIYIARREAFLGRTRGTKSPPVPGTHA